MTQIPADGLHPNLARLAAAYDAIIGQMDCNQLTAVQARARISQLEARDDQGVRWSIDPDTGQFIRKTAFGDSEYDTPPKWGVQTDDAFSYTSDPLVENPNLRLQHTNVTGLTHPPTDLAGATQRPNPQRPSMKAGTFAEVLADLPQKVKVGVVVGIAAVLTVLFTVLGGHGGDPATPAPAPASTTIKAPVKKAPAKKVPAHKSSTKKAPAKKSTAHK